MGALQMNACKDKQIPQKYYQLVDSCLQNTPVIVLGSGASIDAGFPSMWALGKHVCDQLDANASDFPDEEKETWEEFKKQFLQHGDFEKALDDVERRKCTQIRVRVINTVWQNIADIDFDNFQKLVTGNLELPLSKLFSYLARGNSRPLKVVTTNYDRIAEYSAELAGLHHYTGFNYGCMGLWDKQITNMPLTVARRTAKNNNTPSPNNKLVDIWKVHGSIDWFKDGEREQVYSAPLQKIINEQHSPLIVTPGIIKYQTTSSVAPFHNLLAEARQSIEEGRAYLCLGYGFNDSHIQPNLVSKLAEASNRSTIVVLTKKLTPSGRDIFLSGKISNFLIAEEHESGTCIYTHESLTGDVVPVKNLWQLDTFLSEFTNAT